MTKYNVGDWVSVKSIVEDHPSATWHKSNGTLNRPFKIIKITNPEEGAYLLNIPNAPMDFDIFWEVQLEPAQIPA